MDCIFCKIIAGEAESSKVYEDGEILAFMDIQPVRTGQVLVIPKTHIDHFSDIPSGLAMKMFGKAHEITKIIKIKLNPERVGLIVNGYGVPHAHMIVVPQEDKDDITSGRLAEIKNGRVVFNAGNIPVAPRKDLERIAKLIKQALS